MKHTNKHPRYGQLHPSGMNRKQRRTEAAQLRGTDTRLQKSLAEDEHERKKIHTAKRVAKKQGAAHERAIARKEAKKGIKPSLTKRATRAIQASLQKHAQRKARKQAHARKVAKQEAKTV